MPKLPAELEINWPALEPDEIALCMRSIADAGGTVQSGFVDVHQWSGFCGLPDFSVEGGHANAQLRCIALGRPARVRILRLELRHAPDGLRSVRQARAWLSRLDIPQQAVGDIFLGDFAVIALHPAIDPDEYGLHFLALESWEAPQSPVQRLSAAASRADAIASSIFRVSREEAQTALRHGFVWRNSSELRKQSAALSPGDQLIFRTKGRAEIVALENNARSGRQWVSFRLYPC